MRASSKSRSEKKEHRKSLDAYDAAFLDAFDAEFLNTGKGKKKEESTLDSGLSKSKREKRNTFALGDQPLGQLPSTTDENNKIDLSGLASSMHKKNGGNSATAKPKIFTPYKLNDMVMSENNMGRRQQVHSEEVKPSGLPDIASFAPYRKRVETQIETLETSKSTPSLTPLTLPSSTSTPASVSSSKSSSSGRNSILLRLRLGGGTIIAGAVAKDAIEGDSPFHYPRLSLILNMHIT